MAEASGEGTSDGAPASDGLAQIVDIARRRAALIAGCAALSVAAAGTYAALQTPVYRATAELLVSPAALQVVGRDIVRTDSSASLDFATVDSQSLVILSTPVVRRVVDGLDLAADPVYRPRPGLLARLLGPPPAFDPAQTAAAVVEALRSDVVIHRVEGALVFQITVSDPRASRAAEIANALADAYLRETAQDRVDAVRRADASIIAQVAGLRDELDAADAAAEKFRSENGLTKSSENGLVVTQQLKDLYTQIDAAGAEVSRLAARKEQVAKIGPEALIADAVPDALDSPTLITLRAQYAALARDAASLGRTLLPQHPRMIELRAELSEAQRQLRAELGRVRSSVSDSYAQALSALSKLQARARELTRTKDSSSGAETKLRQLESEAQAVRAVFDASLNRARELEQQGKIETGSSRLLSEAVPPARPTKPPLPVVLAAAALFGTCLGFGLAFLLDRLPRRVRNGTLGLRDAGRLLGASTAVALPRAKSEGAAASALGPVAARLRSDLRGRLPAVVAVAAVPTSHGAPLHRAVAEELAELLADLGEEVLLCEHGDPARGLAARRIPARTSTGADRRAERRGSGGRDEFVVTAVTPDRARGQALPADAVVLVADLARTGAAELVAAARAVDPSGRCSLALVAAAPHGRLTRAPRALAEAAA